MRPQELYGQVGMTHEALSGIVDQLRQLVASAEVWDRSKLTVDDSSVMTVDGCVDSVIDEVRRCADSMELAVGPAEAAWAASSRIGDQGK